MSILLFIHIPATLKPADALLVKINPTALSRPPKGSYKFLVLANTLNAEQTEELDNSFFGPKGGKRGRGSERKSTVLCAASLYGDRQNQERLGFAQMRVVDNASAEVSEDFLERLGCGVSTEEGQQLLAVVRTDGWRSYSRAAKDKSLEPC
jgi:hypothetical protein